MWGKSGSPVQERAQRQHGTQPPAIFRTNPSTNGIASLPCSSALCPSCLIQQPARTDALMFACSAGCVWATTKRQSISYTVRHGNIKVCDEVGTLVAARTARDKAMSISVVLAPPWGRRNDSPKFPRRCADANVKICLAMAVAKYHPSIVGEADTQGRNIINICCVLPKTPPSFLQIRPHARCHHDLELSPDQRVRLTTTPPAACHRACHRNETPRERSFSPLERINPWD